MLLTLRRVTAAFGVALALVVASGASAWGAVTGLQRVHADSASGSGSFRSVSASCPAGKQVLGGGAELIGGESQVTLNDVIPDATLTSVNAVAYEDQTGFSGSWSLRAHAICATPPPGLVRVVAGGPIDSADKTETAVCPTDKYLLGGGASIVGATREVMAQDVRLDSLTRVTAEGVEDDDGTGADWRLRAYAICSDRVHMLQRVTAASATDSLKAKTATADCPAGKRVLGVGGEVEGVGGEVALNDLMPTEPMDGAVAHAAEDEDGTASTWLVRSFAICAAASQRFTATNAPASDYFQTAVHECSSDWRATGGGASITAGAGQVRIDGAFPEDDLDPAPPRASVGFFADAFEDANGYAGDWFLRGFAICATPLPDLQSVSEVSPDDSSATTKTVTATCPAGTQVLGAGGLIPSDSGGGPLQVVIYRLTPNASLTSVTAAAYESETGEDRGWPLYATPVCATPPPGLELVVAASPVDSSNKSVTAGCPVDKNLLGAGAMVLGGAGQVVIDDMAPDVRLTSVLVTGLEDETGYPGLWSVRSYAICASP